MNLEWLNKNNNKDLIVFFAGWSFDFHPFEHLLCDNADVLFVYDYNQIDNINELSECINSDYTTKTLITWSMGVYCAYLLKNLFKNFDNKIAINGTVTPVDNDYGIPVRTFELTLKHAQKGLEGKFYQNVYLSEEEMGKYLKKPVERTIENRVQELNSLYDRIKTTSVNVDKFYDFAIISDFDKIIPTSNQIASHKLTNTKIINLPYGHSPFFNFNSWYDIIKLCK